MTSTIKKIFVVVCVLAAVISVYLCEAATTTTTEEPARLTKEKILIEAQKKALRNNCCRLVNTTTDYLENLDLPIDAYPKVIAVSRCQGFCGSVNMGVTSGTCMPDVDGVKEREVAMFEVKNGKKQYYSLVKVTEHTSCRCS
ncbi:hypothetical protein Pmani_022978 [Petrolisthes manimaculis]|uniref:Platelet-derived growth factor (PDGF) family profile domain-containing protein n=1 Tax=Petrolisthes manimaculis TaxID=1843537 RepID=A0AAE1U0M4_9EUCA|nr:hypothetical protein Pmani_022978 [Petrolisthes manimaculis]